MLFQNLTRVLLTLVLVTFIVTACNDEDEDPLFPIPGGFSIQLEGVSLVTYDNGTYEYDPDGAASDFVDNDMIMLSVDRGSLIDTRETRPDSPRYITPLVEIDFYDDLGNDILYPEEKIDGEINPGGDYRLEWEWVDDIHNRRANIEQHGDDGSWAFHFRADQPGETGVIFKIFRCEGDREIESHGSSDNPNNPQRTERVCSLDEGEVFRASAPLMIHVDEYEGIEENGRYPHDRHFRIR